MSVSALPRPNRRRPDWRKAGLATAAVAINTALIAALSFTALGIEGGDIVAAPRRSISTSSPAPCCPMSDRASRP